MKRRTDRSLKVLVIDVGGSHVKCVATHHRTRVAFESGPKLTPKQMVRGVLKITGSWEFDVVSIGYPGAVSHGQIVHDPFNLAPGWIGFDFQSAFKRPVSVINDAAMQALGSYEGGKMLFLGLGTGLGSTLIVDGVIVPMELGHLPFAHGQSYEDYVGEAGRKRMGNKLWRVKALDIVEAFRKALLPDYIVLGGGNSTRLKDLPPKTQVGANANAFVGGFRLWKDHNEKQWSGDRPIEKVPKVK